MSMLPLTTSIHEAYSSIASKLNGSASKPFHVQREQAFEEFSRVGIPTVRSEEFKYTNVMPLASLSWHHAQPAWSDEGIAPADTSLPGMEHAIRIDVHNGSIRVNSTGSLPEGLRICPLTEVDAADPNAAVISGNPFGAVSLALASEGICIDVADNAVISVTVHVCVQSDASNGDLLSTTRILVRVGRCAQVDIVESHHSSGNAKVLDLSLCSVHVAESANASYVKIIDDGTRLAHIGQVSAIVERTGNFASHSVNLAAGFVRNDAQIRLAGQGSQGFLYGVSVLNTNEYVDNHTVVDHMVPHCHSEELYKGVYDDSSMGVFNGKIFVRPQAQKTTAYQSSHSLLLSNKAQVNAKPQLEIWADDVKCSHGATTGQLNEDALYYLQARGIERAKAVSMLTYAFAAEVVDKLPHEELRSYILQRLAEKLGAQDL